jgi:NADH-quinone oxidoreductase subunit H
MADSVLVDGIKIGVVFGALLTVMPALVYVERKVCAWIQDRVGPNRVGPFGLLQPLADAVKLLFKENVFPEQADRFLYILAPLIALCTPILVFSVIPFGHPVRLWPEGPRVTLQIADPPAGALLVLAVASLGVYGIALGGWASNNKYALLGSLRASAQLISYEILFSLAILAVLMSTSDAQGIGTVRMSQIVERQAEFVRILGIPLPGWIAFRQPVAFLLFGVAVFAETNRLPFDMPECESELVGGYHTEYSSMSFSMFFMGEYLAMVSMAALATTLFLGGWHVPGLDPAGTSLLSGFASVAGFAAKTGALLFVYLWVRWSLPRFRYDQIMRIAWKGLLPVGILNLLVTAALALR